MTELIFVLLWKERIAVFFPYREGKEGKLAWYWGVRYPPDHD